MPHNKPAIAKHIKRMGEICYCWNELHVCFMLIFSTLIEKNNPDKGMAIWNSLANDKGQRKMLIKLAEQQLDNKSMLFKNILWVKEKTDRLSKFRNAYVHSAVSSTFAISKNHKIHLEQMISNKEFARLRGDLIVLKKYSLGMALHAMFSERALSSLNRPRLLSIVESNSQDTQIKNRRKKLALKRQPQSSAQ